nr:hypothetical protein Iba_chr12cCG16890 [Ipomoea batatas]
MSSSGDEQASSGGVDLRLLAAVSELRATGVNDDDNLELRPPSSCLGLQFRRWSDISSAGESLAAAVREQGAISLLARSPELQSIKVMEYYLVIFFIFAQYMNAYAPLMG